jgi:hypothetical protein
MLITESRHRVAPRPAGATVTWPIVLADPRPAWPQAKNPIRCSVGPGTCGSGSNKALPVRGLHGSLSFPFGDGTLQFRLPRA